MLHRSMGGRSDAAPQRGYRANIRELIAFRIQLIAFSV
jgi:hypothetical protein